MTNTTGLNETIFVLVGVVVGGMDRLPSATLGGFAIGFANSFVGFELATQGSTSQTAAPFTSSVYLPSVIYVLVILVLLLRPAACSRAAGPGGGGARMKRFETLLQLAVPVLLVVLTAVVASAAASPADSVKFRNVIIEIAIVVGLYVFVGNSGVLSFGQISFVALGAFAAGVMTVPSDVKPGVLPELFPFIKHHSIDNVTSLLLATGVGMVYALVVGVPLDAPVRPGRGHRHLRRARDHLQHPQVLGPHRTGRDDAEPDPGDDRLPAGDRGTVG